MIVPPFIIYATNFYGHSNVNESIEISMLDENFNQFSYFAVLLKKSIDLQKYISTVPFGLKCRLNKRLEETTRLYIITITEPGDLNVGHKVNVVNTILEKIQEKKIDELSENKLTQRIPIFVQYQVTNIYRNCHDLLKNFQSINIVYTNKRLPSHYAFYDTTTLENCIDYKTRVMHNESNQIVNIPIYAKSLICPERSNVISLRDYRLRHNKVTYWALSTYDGNGEFKFYEISKNPSDIIPMRWFKINSILRITNEFKLLSTHLAYLKLDNLIFWVSSLYTLLSADDELIYFDDEQLLNINGLDAYFTKFSADQMSYSFTDFNTLPICQISKIQDVFTSYNFHNIHYTKRSIYAFDEDHSTVMFIGLLNHDILKDHMENFHAIKF